MIFLRRYNILWLILVILTVSCGKEIRPEKPKNLIPEKEFTDILFDMFVINSAKGVNKKVMEEVGLKPEIYVFEKYQIDSLQFAKSNEYYAFDSKKYTAILNRVKQNIESQKKLFEKQIKDEEEEQKRKMDSIKELNLKIRDSLKVKINREFEGVPSKN